MKSPIKVLGPSKTALVALEGAVAGIVAYMLILYTMPHSKPWLGVLVSVPIAVIFFLLMRMLKAKIRCALLKRRISRLVIVTTTHKQQSLLKIRGSDGNSNKSS